MQEFVERWLILEISYQMKHSFMMADVGIRCIMGMPMSMPKVIENCFANVMEKIMSFIQEAQHLVLRHLPVSLVETI